MRRRLPWAGLLALSGCAHPQSVFSPAGDEAGQLFSLLTLMLWVCGVFYLLVLAFLGASLWRNRRALETTGPDPTPTDPGLKAGLVGWTLLMAVGLVVLTGASFLVDRSFASSRAPALQVRVTGHQWWWRIQYPDGAGGWIETANELHLPVDRPVEVSLSAGDVIHSFWLPTLSGKIDMIPGRTNRLRITPRKLGMFRGQCAEFCGLQHTQMALDVKVETSQAFQAWLSAQAAPASPAPADASVVKGREIVLSGPCAQCHAIRGAGAVGRAGPDLTHVASRSSIAAGALPRTRGALMGWITQPQAAKPGAQMPPAELAPGDALAVVSYLETLK